MNVANYGGKNLAPVLALSNYKKLGISKSYFYKLKAKANNNEDISKIKAISKLKKNVPYSIAIGKDTPSINFNLKKEINALKRQKVITYKGSDNKLKKKEPKFIWVKFKLFSKGNVYYQSSVLSKDRINELEQFISDYLDTNVKKYDKHKVFVMEIAIEQI